MRYALKFRRSLIDALLFVLLAYRDFSAPITDITVAEPHVA
jgi:hypothetical protein